MGEPWVIYLFDGFYIFLYRDNFHNRRMKRKWLDAFKWLVVQRIPFFFNRFSSSEWFCVFWKATAQTQQTLDKPNRNVRQHSWMNNCSEQFVKSQRLPCVNDFISIIWNVSTNTPMGKTVLQVLKFKYVLYNSLIQRYGRLISKKSWLMLWHIQYAAFKLGINDFPNYRCPIDSMIVFPYFYLFCVANLRKLWKSHRLGT